MTETTQRQAPKPRTYYKLGPVKIRVRGWILAGFLLGLAFWAVILWWIFA